MNSFDVFFIKGFTVGKTVSIVLSGSEIIFNVSEPKLVEKEEILIYFILTNNYALVKGHLS